MPLDAWIIEEIRRREGWKPEELPLEAPEEPPAEPEPEEGDRGVVTIDLR